MQTTCGAVSQGQREEIDWQFSLTSSLPPCNLLTTPQGILSLCVKQTVKRQPGNSRATKNKGMGGSLIRRELSWWMISRLRRPGSGPVEPRRTELHLHCCYESISRLTVWRLPLILSVCCRQCWYTGQVQLLSTCRPPPHIHTCTQSLDVTRQGYLDKDKSTIFFNISATISAGLLS